MEQVNFDARETVLTAFEMTLDGALSKPSEALEVDFLGHSNVSFSLLLVLEPQLCGNAGSKSKRKKGPASWITTTEITERKLLTQVTRVENVFPLVLEQANPWEWPPQAVHAQMCIGTHKHHRVRSTICTKCSLERNSASVPPTTCELFQKSISRLSIREQLRIFLLLWATGQTCRVLLCVEVRTLFKQFSLLWGAWLFCSWHMSHVLEEWRIDPDLLMEAHSDAPSA
eukprot:6051330-Amphidinium_carterae.1